MFLHSPAILSQTPGNFRDRAKVFPFQEGAVALMISQTSSAYLPINLTVWQFGQPLETLELFLSALEGWRLPLDGYLFVLHFSLPCA